MSNWYARMWEDLPDDDGPGVAAALITWVLLHVVGLVCWGWVMIALIERNAWPVMVTFTLAVVGYGLFNLWRVARRIR